MTQTLPIGPIMLDVEGWTLAPHEKEKINHPNTGAVILFSRNYQNPEQ
ncbi:MAG: beta-N-acetylhexosaminidase, partial [Methylosarcina sp.]